MVEAYMSSIADEIIIDYTKYLITRQTRTKQSNFIWLYPKQSLFCCLMRYKIIDGEKRWSLYKKRSFIAATQLPSSFLRPSNMLMELIVTRQE